MMKVLLVEDEPRIREGLRTAINWNSLGLTLAGEASDGLGAFQLIESLKPDIVLTDIRMPRMDGLALIKKLKSSNREILTIILSGYGDFNYAKAALRLGVFDYILKPSRAVEVERVLLKAAQNLLEKKQDKEQLSWLQNHWRHNVPIVKKEALGRWILRTNLPNENRGDLAATLQLKIKAEPMHVGLIHFYRRSLQALEYSVKDQELIRYAGENITAELLQKIYNNNLETLQHGEEIIWIANPPFTLAADDLRHQLQELIDQFKRFLNVDICITVGSEADDYARIHQSYESAKKAMERCIFNGPNTIVLYSDLREHAGLTSSIPDEDVEAKLSALETDLVERLQTGNYAEALDLKDEWLDLLQAFAQNDKLKVVARATAFLAGWHHLFKSYAGFLDKWRDEFQNWLEQSAKAESFDDFSVLLTKMIRTLAEEMAAEQQLHRTVRAVLHIIHEKYAENLTLEALAKEVYVSSPYLSTLFKQEMGINFLDYLHQYRVEVAKTLLSEKQLKVFAVSRLVGYQDDRYFSQLFKKWTGMTPSSYKQQFHRTAPRI